MRLRLAVLSVAALGAVGCSPNVVGSTSSSTGSAGASTGTTGAATTSSTSSTGGTTGTVAGSSSGATFGSDSTGTTGTTAGSTGGTTSGSSGTTGAPSPGAYPNPPYGVVVTKTLQNFSFHGYLSDSSGARIDGVTSQTDFSLQDVRSLVQPDGTHLYKYLLLSVGAGWCPPCNQEADDIGLSGTYSGKVAEWKGKNGLVLTVLSQGYDETTGAPPDPTDITTWLTDHSTQNSLALDLPSALVNAGIQTAAFPANLVINLRTMRIDDAWYGLDETFGPWENELANQP
jgi:hypothetical protein